MPIQITITAENAVEANHLVQDLAGAMSHMDLADVPEKTEVSTIRSAKPKQAEPDPEETAYTLEEVRAKLAAISQSGKQAQVKELITSFGASKLTDIPAEKYTELMEEAEAIV